MIMMSKKIEVPKVVSKTESVFFNELRDFRGETVTIHLLNGSSVRARVLAIEFNNLSFIVEYADGVKEMIRGEAIQSVRLGTKIEKE
jgi:sRNA-binding regulator protein Hfq